MSQPVVEVEDLAYRYRGREALCGVSFTVRSAEIFGLLGPNGGGKTTLLQILATLRLPASGSARIGGIDVARRPGEARRRIGVVFQHPSLDLCLTARENLRHQGHLHGLRGHDLARRIAQGLEGAGVPERADERAGALSGGLRRRVELAKGLLHRPPVLLLDEPTSGLDPGGRRDYWAQLRQMRQDEGTAAVVATHLMEEAEGCDRVAILDRGVFVALGAPETLRGEIRGDIVSLEARDPAQLATEIARRFGEKAAVIDGRVRIERQDGAAFVPRLAEEFPGLIRSITVGRPTLEDVFVQLTGHRFRDAPEREAGGNGTPERRARG
ncbi:ABC transporter ATP-binding protein [soil metagenome]